MTRLRVWMTLVIQLAVAAPLVAQPWVPARGEGTVSMTYQNYYVLGHFDVAGNENTNGATHAKAMIAELDVGVTDSFALTISLPYIATKYTGPEEYVVGGFPVHAGPLDEDRKYHGTFQDFRVEARRLWWAGPIAIAPLAAVTIPSHNYETHGEAVAGRHRLDAQIGASAGVDLNRWVPHTYAHGRYGFSAAQPIHGFQSVRSNIDAEFGADVASRVSLRGLSSWQIRHLGPTIPELEAFDWLGHDRLIVSSYFNAGGGMDISLTSKTEFYALWIATVSGASGAHRARMLATGLTWSFGSGGGFGNFDPVKGERSR